jgi:RNA polymerase sigma factor (sigma-70 family)
MNRQGSKPEIDPSLLPFLRASDEAESQALLSQLIEQAAPVIKKITGRSLDPEDAFQEATRLLIKQLRDLKADPDGKTISNYLHYVKVVASHVAKGQLRDEHPHRRSLTDALRYVLKKPPFALWENESQERLCGLAVWCEQSTAITRSDRLTQLLDCPRLLDEVAGRDAQSLDNSELLAAIFDWVGHPVRFDQAVRIVCDLKRIEELTPITDDKEEARPLSELLEDTRRRPDEEAEWREFLNLLWAEIEQLPPLQRIAYLLNFTSADGELELFLVYGAATIRRIGAVLQLTEDHFARAWMDLQLSEEERRRASLAGYDERFALLWQRLPLADTTIARMLGTERQKVINLRKAASDRLSRRMAHRIRDA